MIRTLFASVPDKGVFRDPNGFTYIKRLPLLADGVNCVRIVELDPSETDSPIFIYFPMLAVVDLFEEGDYSRLSNTKFRAEKEENYSKP